MPSPTRPAVETAKGAAEDQTETSSLKTARPRAATYNWAADTQTETRAGAPATVYAPTGNLAACEATEMSASSEATACAGTAVYETGTPIGTFSTVMATADVQIASSGTARASETHSRKEATACV